MDESLTSFIEEVCGDSHLRVEDDFGDGFVRLKSSEAERRQAQHDIRCTEDIIIEMLRNSRDAGARNIFVATSRESNIRKISVIDDGDGVPTEMQEKIFEPRVTSKLNTMHVDRWGVHGRGMALYSIAVNSKKAFVVDSGPFLGSAFVVECDLDLLSEKSDQSSMPDLSYGEDGELVVKGPRNINRCIAEFSFESKDTCSVYHGSPTDIVATLFSYGEATMSKNARMFCTDPHELTLVKRLCVAGDPESLTKASAAVGLDISERSARRVLDGEIKPLFSIVELFESKNLLHSTKKEGSSRAQKRSIQKLDGAHLAKDARGLKIDDKDINEFKQNIKAAYCDLAQGYYLESDIEPEIRISSNDMHITIPLDKLR